MYKTIKMIAECGGKLTGKTGPRKKQKVANTALHTSPPPTDVSQPHDEPSFDSDEENAKELRYHETAKERLGAELRQCSGLPCAMSLRGGGGGGGGGSSGGFGSAGSTGSNSSAGGGGGGDEDDADDTAITLEDCNHLVTVQLKRKRDEDDDDDDDDDDDEEDVVALLVCLFCERHMLIDTKLSTSTHVALNAPEPGNSNGTAVYTPVLTHKHKLASATIHVFVVGNCPTHPDGLGNNMSKLVLGSKAAGIWHGWTPQRCPCPRLDHRFHHRVSNPSHTLSPCSD